MLSPALVELNREACVLDERPETIVDLDGHHATSDLDEFDLGEEQEAEAA